MRSIFAILLAAAPWLLGSTPALAGEREDAWATCIWERVPTTAANWLSFEQAGRRAYVELLLFDKNFAKGPDAVLALNDELRSAFLEVRLEAACADTMEVAGKRTDFKPKGIRKSLEGLRPDIVGADLFEPDSYLCVVYDEGLAQAMAFGIGGVEEVRVTRPTATLRCFDITSTGDLSPLPANNVAERDDA